MTDFVTISQDSKGTLNFLSNIDREMQRAIRQGWFRLGDELSAELNQQVLKKPRSGRVYIRRIRGGARRRHRASRPGETPANLTGAYRRSRGYQIRGFRQLEFGVRDRKGAWLEEGTRNMAPRPGIRNAVKAKENQISPIMENSMRALFSS